MNERRDYTQTRFPATFLGDGTYHGRHGMARHRAGDDWEFDPLGVTGQMFVVHRTEIGLEPVTHDPVVRPRDLKAGRAAWKGER